MRVSRYSGIEFSNELILQDATVASFNLLLTDSRLPTQLIPVAFCRVNHTFLYLYPRDR